MQHARINILKIVVFLLAVALIRFDAWGADASLRCVYDLLVHARESFIFCNYDIDADKENKYAEVRAALKKFINSNVSASHRTIDEDHDEGIRTAIENNAAFCQSSGYLVVKDWFLEAMTPEGIATIHKRLEIPSDPDDGDCL